MILAADVLWVSSQHDALLQTVCTLLKRDAGARFVLAAGFHTGRPAVVRFFDAARHAGLALDTQAPYGGAYEQNIAGDVRPWEGTDEEMGDIQERAQWVVLASWRWAD